ncbi:hypothetical protein Nepgr_004288 [Nepenthes gracilis]|uniref:IBH1-like N-terminal domain-containing protein n=1 Tax=Nepenthes gracilis TaxID=150966 RepID=A0AAD3S142_NEPGR|nr:hypothetical protein Nepgr_004288 [Nepenthes gracilis]
MNPHPSSSLNPRSIKTRFAFRFLRALKKINSKRPTSCSSSSREISKRYRRVMFAAESSMALAVGPGKAWSRAMLIMLRSRIHARRHASIRRLRENDSHAVRRKKLMTKRKRHNMLDSSQENELRRLVPGGHAMDLCCLFDETAHYIKCLTTQME